MTTWKKHKLSSVAKVIDCPHSTPKWINEGIFVVRNFNLSNGKIVRDKSSYTDLETFEKRTLRATPRFGDCILSREAPIGSIGYISTNEKVCLGQRVVLIRPTNIDPAFLKFKLLSDEVQNQFRQSDNSGSTVSNLRIPSIENTQLTLPDEDIQIQISSVISAYDDLIDNNEKRIKILEEMAQRLYTEWFVKFKFPGHEKVKIVDSGTEFGMIPDGWKVVSVESRIKRIPVGKRYENKTVFETGLIPVLDQGKTGVIGYHNEEPGVKASVDSPVIVFANHTCYQNLIVFPFSTIQNVLPFVPMDDRNIYWLYWTTKDLIKFSDYKGHWPDFMSKQLLLPPAELTRRFGDIVRTFVAQKYKLTISNGNLKKMRDLLISQLVTGKRELKG